MGAEGDGATPNSDLVVELARRECSTNLTQPSEEPIASFHYWGVSNQSLRETSFLSQTLLGTRRATLTHVAFGLALSPAAPPMCDIFRSFYRALLSQ